MRPLERLLLDAQSERLFSGAAYEVGSADSALESGFVGATSWEHGSAVTPGTVWDIASVTKPIVALQAMVLIEAGELALGDSVGRLLPDYSGTDKAEITVAELLTHSSGIPGQQPLYQTCATRQQLLDAVRALPLRFPASTGVEYTSQGFMVLGEVLEAVTGESLDALVSAHVLEPLGMTATCFRPPIANQATIAATEWCPWRGELVQGEVHDENAVVLGGVAGHAGMFSTPSDLGRLARSMLREGELDGQRVLEAATVQEMTRPWTDHLPLRRCLGWQGADRDGCPAGTHASGLSFGHTGFTGTSVWIDPVRAVYAVLLTNAVHPRRRPATMRALRPRFHDLVFGGDGC